MRRLPRNIWAVTITSFLTDISSEMIFNLLPLFLANVLRVQTSAIGLIEGVADATTSLVKGASGWWSDRIHSRKWLAVLGYGISTAAKPFLYLVSSWAGVLAVRTTDRIGKGVRTAPRDALIADSVDEKTRGIAFGLHRAGDTLGAVIGLGIAIAVVLAMQAGAAALTDETFRALVLISIIPAALAVLILALTARDVTTRPKVAKGEAPRLTWGTLDARFRAFLPIVLIFTLGNSADAFLILRAQERGMTVAGILGMLLAFNLIYTLVAGPAGALSDRIGRFRLIRFGWLVYGLIYLGFALAAETWQIVALYAAYGIYYGSVEGVVKALVADLVPSAQRGTAYGIYNAAVGLMALPASILAGLLWQVIGPSAPFLVGAGLALLAVALYTRWQARYDQHKAGVVA